MTIQFDKSVDAVKFFSDPAHDVNKYSVGLDKDKHIVVKENTWFNTSWLGRIIDNLKGNNFDENSYFKVTQQIDRLANQELTKDEFKLLEEESSDEDARLIKGAKRLETSLLKTAIDRFGDTGVRMIQAFQGQFHLQRKLEEIGAKGEEPVKELSEAEKAEEAKLSPVQKEIKAKLSEKWDTAIEPNLKKQLASPAEVWKNLLGGKEQRSVDHFTIEEKIGEKFEELSFLFKKFSELGTTRPENFGKFQTLFDKVEDLRQKAFDGGELSAEETGYIQKFYAIRDEFTKTLNEKTQEVLAQTKKDFIDKMMKGFEQIPAGTGAPQQVAIKADVKIEMDANPMLNEELAKVYKQLEELDSQIKSPGLDVKFF